MEMNRAAGSMKRAWRTAMISGYQLSPRVNGGVRAVGPSCLLFPRDDQLTAQGFRITTRPMAAGNHLTSAICGNRGDAPSTGRRLAELSLFSLRSGRAMELSGRSWNCRAVLSAVCMRVCGREVRAFSLYCDGLCQDR